MLNSVENTNLRSSVVSLWEEECKNRLWCQHFGIVSGNATEISTFRRKARIKKCVSSSSHVAHIQCVNTHTDNHSSTHRYKGTYMYYIFSSVRHTTNGAVPIQAKITFFTANSLPE